MTASTRVRVEYAKKIGDANSYSSTTYGGAFEFDIPKDADWQQSYGGAFAILKTIVDSQIEQAAVSNAGVPQPVAATAAPPPPDPTVPQPAESPTEIPDPDTLVAYNSAKVVFDPEEKTDSNGNQYITVRLDHLEIPGRYRHGKSYDPDVMHLIEALRKGDRVDISGHYERPWTDRKGQTQAALMVEEVERIKAEPTAAK